MWKILKAGHERQKMFGKAQERRETSEGGGGHAVRENMRGSGFDRLDGREFLVSKKSVVVLKLVQE